MKNARLKQSVCRWCYQRIPLEDFFKGVKAIGLTAVDLLQPEEWDVAAKYGLQTSTGYPGQGGGTIPDALNNPALHDAIEAAFKTALPEGQGVEDPESDHLLRQPQGDARRAGDRQLRRGAEPASRGWPRITA